MTRLARVTGTVGRIWRRGRLLMRRRRAERQMDDEIQFHIEREAAGHVARGLTPQDARRLAEREFGSVLAVKESARDQRGLRSVEDLGQDLRYAGRLLRHHPGFTIPAVLTFALGVGAATAIFSVVYGVLFRPLPFRDPGRLAVIWEHDVVHGNRENVVSIDALKAWQEQDRSFQELSAVVPNTVTLATSNGTARIVGAEVTPGYFHVLGIAPARGRDFTADDALPGATPVVLLSDGLWRRELGADPAAVGRTIALSGRPYLIVGVMPPRFAPPKVGWLGTQEYWCPSAVTDNKRSWGRFLIVIGRLNDRVSLTEARAGIAAIAEHRAHESRTNEGWSATVVPLSEQIVGDARRPLLVVLAAVGLLLTMAMSSVIMLTLSFNSRRSDELAMRRVIGASDGRIFRQLLTQGVVIGALGTVVALVLLRPLVLVLLAWLPPDVPRADEIRLDVPVFVASAALSVAATLMSAALSARVRRDRHAGAALPRWSGGRTTAARTGAPLVVAEVAIALILSLMALLMGRSLAALTAIDLGFRPDGVLVARLATPNDSGPTTGLMARFGAVAASAQSLPDVSGVGLIGLRPFGGPGPATTAQNPVTPLPASQAPVADVRRASAGSFAALGMTFTSGHTFDDDDRDSRAPVAVITEGTARAIWPGVDPIDRHVRLEMYGGISPRIIGVVRDIRLADARTPPRPAVFLSLSQFPSEIVELAVNTTRSPLDLVPALRAIVAAAFPGAPLYQVSDLRQSVDRSLARERFTLWLLSSFAAIALCLAAIGVFGVFSAAVTQRRKEIGIRLALGARPQRIALNLLRPALTMTMIGIVLGLAGARLLTTSMSALLFGVSPTDAASFAAVSIGVLVIAIVATLLPIVRTLRESPVRALRIDG